MTLNRRINLQLLAHLDALVSERHVTRAAEKMGIGQPAMSGSLARLRTLFHDPLLVKTGRGMEPTPRALTLARQIHEALAILEDAANSDAEFRLATAQASVEILSSDGLTQLFLPGLMQRVRAQAPNLRLNVMPGDIRRMSEMLRDGECDLALGFTRTLSSSLYRTLLYPQRVVCIASHGHPSIRGTLALAQFVAARHVVWGSPPVPLPTMEQLVDEALALLGLERHVCLRVGSAQLSPPIVAETDLLAVVPERLALNCGTELQVLPLPFSMPRIDIHMFWHERRHRDPAHAWLRGELKRLADDIAEHAGSRPDLAGRPGRP